MIWFDLIYKLALLVALSVISSFIAGRWRRTTTAGQLLQGMLFGTTAVIGMLSPVVISEGLIFDGRSVMLSLVALFYGPLASLVAAWMTIVTRIGQGGVGALPGVMVILSSIGTGLFFHYRKRRALSNWSVSELYLIGVLVHSAMLLMMLLLPREMIVPVLSQITLPVMVIYPLASLLAGKILVDQIANTDMLEALNTSLEQLKISEQYLRESEEKFRSLFENHAAVKLIIDPDSGLIVDANASAAKFYGWPVEQLKRMNINEINTLPSERIRAEMETARRQNRIHFDFIHRKADGSETRVEVFTSKIRLGDKDYLHAIVHDVSDKQRLEDQLNTIQKLDSIGRLAGGIAHDFNNQLTSMMSSAELCMATLDAAHPGRKHLDEIMRSAYHSAALTGQLLAFARKQAVAPRDVNLNEAVAGTLKMLRRLIGEHIELTWNPGTDLWFVHIDPVQIEQILVNLCVNARDVIGTGGRISLSTSNLPMPSGVASALVGDASAAGDYVTLVVSDTGSGMTPEVMAHIYEPFFTTKATGEGAGLGLSMVYGIVKQNNGFINVESKVGRGTTFHLYFPRHQAR